MFPSHYGYWSNMFQPLIFPYLIFLKCGWDSSKYRFGKFQTKYNFSTDIKLDCVITSWWSEVRVVSIWWELPNLFKPLWLNLLAQYWILLAATITFGEGSKQSFGLCISANLDSRRSLSSWVHLLESDINEFTSRTIVYIKDITHL